MEHSYFRGLAAGMTAVLAVSAFPVWASETEKHAYYGIVNAHGIECPSQGFKLQIPEDFGITDRGEITFNGEVRQQDPNEEKTFEALDIGLEMGGAEFFEAKNGMDYITMYLEDPGYGYDVWGELSEIAAAACDKYIQEMAEDADYEDGQGFAEEGIFAGKKCCINRFTSKLYGEPFYRTVVYLMSEDQMYLTQICLDSWTEDRSDMLMSYFSEM